METRKRSDVLDVYMIAQRHDVLPRDGASGRNRTGMPCGGGFSYLLLLAQPKVAGAASVWGLDSVLTVPNMPPRMGVDTRLA